MKEYKYVIIGSGAAGINAAASISENTENKEEILVLTDESVRYYYRPRIIDYIADRAKLDDFIYYDKKWFKERNILVQYENPAVKINTDDKIVESKSGEKFKYVKLLIATGGHPFVPGIFKNLNAFTIRKVEDADNIKASFNNNEKWCIIGGGLLGLETAGAIAKKNKNVFVIETADYPLPKQLDKEGGNFLKEKIETLGIKLYTNAEIEGIDNEKVKIKNNGVHEFDKLVICTGIRPNLSIIENTQIKTDKAILINDYFETNINDIYAAGDCAIHNGIIYGTWMPAQEQGKIAGLNMCGKKEKYTGSKKEYKLKVVGIELTSVGNIKSNKELNYIDKDNNIYKKAFSEKEKLVGFILFGDSSDEAKIIDNLNDDIKKSKKYFSEKDLDMDSNETYTCNICGYVYDPEKGDSNADIKPGTPFSELPDDWVCPICGAKKDQFSKN